MAITKLALNGKEYNIGMEGPQMYEGRDLSAYTWDDLKNMSRDGDYSDIRVGDFKEITLTGGEKVIMEVAGIDTYYNCGYGEQHGDYDIRTLAPIPHHIDWISRDCLTQTYQWNTTATNNALSDDPTKDDGTDVPYLNSTIHQKLEDIYATVPDKVKSAIIPKIYLLERRGHKQDTAALNDSTGWHWYPMGYLWIPSEYEVFGSVVWGTKGWSAGQAMQYPLFANSYKHRIKGLGNGGSRYAWWLCSVASGNSTSCCSVTGSGYASYGTATHSLGVPVCFRTAATTALA